MKIYIIKFLYDIKKHNMLRVSVWDKRIYHALVFSVDNELLIRTISGNITLTEKGLALLNGKLGWSSLVNNSFEMDPGVEDRLLAFFK